MSKQSNLVNSSQDITVDASGNVGIGRGEPSAKLDILGASSDQIRLATASTEHYAIGRNASTGLLDFYGSQTGYTGYTFGGVNGERMRIDSAGRVTMPYQPAFWAFNGGGTTQSTGVATFASTQTNRGGHYSGSSSAFTAPVAGVYCFHGMLLHRTNGVAGNAEWTFIVNGANISGRGVVYSAGTIPSGHIPASSQVFLTLNANDYVQMNIHYMSSGQDYYTGERLAHFSGYLIG